MESGKQRQGLPSSRGIFRRNGDFSNVMRMLGYDVRGCSGSIHIVTSENEHNRRGSQMFHFRLAIYPTQSLNPISPPTTPPISPFHPLYPPTPLPFPEISPYCPPLRLPIQQPCTEPHLPLTLRTNPRLPPIEPRPLLRHSSAGDGRVADEAHAAHGRWAGTCAAAAGVGDGLFFAHGGRGG